MPGKDQSKSHSQAIADIRKNAIKKGNEFVDTIVARGKGEPTSEQLPDPDLGESMQEPGPGEDLNPRLGVIARGKEKLLAEAGRPAPGLYGADGDPYVYEVMADGSITLADGPTGKGITVTPDSVAFRAIMGQIDSGTLSNMGPSEMPAGTPDGPATMLVQESVPDSAAKERKMPATLLDQGSVEDPMSKYRSERSSTIAKHTPK